MGWWTGRRRAIAAGLAAVALLAAGCGDDDDGDDDAGGETEVPAATSYAIGAGINDPDDANIAVLEFLPEDVTVEVGTDITWEWSGTEPHSVTFVPEGQAPPNVEEDPNAGAPVPATKPIDGSELVSSGLQPFGEPAVPFDATFDTPGTYDYLCIIHPTMTGTIEVVDGGDDVDSMQDVAEERAEDTEEYLAEGRAAKAELVGRDPVMTANADGTTTWTVEMGVTTEHVDVLAFAPTPAAVKAGDTVTFTNSSMAPHTATFFGTGAEAIQDPFDPRVLAPAPGPSPQALAAAGYFNTGWIPGDTGAPPEARTYSFTVPAAGTYAYVCMLHAPSEMVGAIEAT